MSAVVSLVPLILIGLGALVVLFLLAGIRFIPNNKVGIVEMRISPMGSLDKGVIALKGEAGFQPGWRRAGLPSLLPSKSAGHFGPRVRTPKGKIGYGSSRDGHPLRPHRRWRRTPRPWTSRTCGSSCREAASAGRSARSCARV